MSNTVKNMDELAKLVGISRQGLYKRLRKAGIDPTSLRSGGCLSPDGVAAALEALGVTPCKPVDTEFTPGCQPNCKPECQLSTESGEAADGIEGENPINCKPVDSEFTRSWHPECQPSTDSVNQCKPVDSDSAPDCQPAPEATALPEEAKAPTDAERVEALLKELAAAHAELVEQRHKAELADLRAEAAANERDYLREQLDKAIKANALASMKRLETPENNSPSKGWAYRLRAAWSTIRGKDRG